MKKISSSIEGLKFIGAFIPSSDWSYALLFDTTRFDKAMQVYRTIIKKFEGQHPQTFVSKLEILFSREEVGFSD